MYYQMQIKELLTVQLNKAEKRFKNERIKEHREMERSKLFLLHHGNGIEIQGIKYRKIYYIRKKLKEPGKSQAFFIY